MNRPYLLFLLLFISCNNTHQYKKSANKFSHLAQDYQKSSSSKKAPPTESAWIGNGKGEKKYILVSKESYIQEARESEELERYENPNLDEDSYIGKYKVGNPYKIAGVTYQPREYDHLEEVGIASWYGDDFHGKPTANGEIYHKGDMTAAHPTLPLPSMVRITNLKNGRSVKVRVNDRGPFSKKRIVDVSERAAIELGFKNEGTGNVKLEYLKDDTEDMLEDLGLSRD
ncbi:MAG: hypothetical protein K0R25_1167 [Rickettsiaceae bacterium]|jgi:rare lipoprotein A (peptidoglycan hydrolase)|nr:hypothetical protein [Rickettsiaceae bacterium]